MCSSDLRNLPREDQPIIKKKKKKVAKAAAPIPDPPTTIITAAVGVSAEAINAPIPNPPSTQDPISASLIIPKIEAGLALTTPRLDTTPITTPTTEVVDLTESPIKLTSPLIHAPPSIELPPAKRLRTDEGPAASPLAPLTGEDPMLWLPEVLRRHAGAPLRCDDTATNAETAMTLASTLLLPVDLMANSAEDFNVLATRFYMDAIQVCWQ